jgi:hypothetical protein
MTIELNINQIKERALNLIPLEAEQAFKDHFDSDEFQSDFFLNIDDYIAEGVASTYLNNLNETSED